MKRCRYIYLGVDQKNNRFYFDEITKKVYEVGKNSTSGNSKILPFAGATCVIVYAIFKNMKLQTGGVPIEIYIMASAIIGIILAIISSIYANRTNDKMFSQCESYVLAQETEWEQILSEGRKMAKIHIQLRVIMIVAAIAIAVFIKMHQNPLFLFYNVIIWWLLAFFFSNTKVGRTKRVIRDMNQYVHNI